MMRAQYEILDHDRKIVWAFAFNRRVTDSELTLAFADRVALGSRPLGMATVNGRRGYQIMFAEIADEWFSKQ